MNSYLACELLHYCNISVPKSSEMGESTTDYYDLTFVLSGELVYRINGKILRLKKNDAILLPPGTKRARLALAESVDYASFNFRAFDGVELPLDIFLKNGVTSGIRKILSAFPQSHILPYYNSREKALNILNFILLELLSSSGLDTSNEHVLSAVKYIDSHVTEKMTLSSLAEKLNLSREYLSSVFRKETGKTLTDYINERKMLLAKELISAEEMSLSDVAEHLGFDNYNYFSRLFRRYFDIPPMKLRRKSQKNICD